ncbi:MAG: hypothetical protein FJX56_02550, partial [Alphaproteobacteria bacterium]|nr:hypothetical protein [Alphaproteobacteria bacterium]
AAVAGVALLAGLGVRAPYDAARAEARALASAPDPFAAARRASGTLAERLTDCVIGPIFWFVLLGFPGLLACRAVALTSLALDPRRPQFAAFGALASRLNDAILMLPGLLATVLIGLAALVVPGGNALAAWTGVLRRATLHRSRAYGFAAGALAGALGLALGDPGRDGGQWIGAADGRARVTARDLHRAL